MFPPRFTVAMLVLVVSPTRRSPDSCYARSGKRCASGPASMCKIGDEQGRALRLLRSPTRHGRMVKSGCGNACRRWLDDAGRCRRRDAQLHGYITPATAFVSSSPTAPSSVTRRRRTPIFALYNGVRLAPILSLTEAALRRGFACGDAISARARPPTFLTAALMRTDALSQLFATCPTTTRRANARCRTGTFQRSSRSTSISAATALFIAGTAPGLSMIASAATGGLGMKTTDCRTEGSSRRRIAYAQEYRRSTTAETMRQTSSRLASNFGAGAGSPCRPADLARCLQLVWTQALYDSLSVWCEFR